MAYNPALEQLRKQAEQRLYQKRLQEQAAREENFKMKSLFDPLLNIEGRKRLGGDNWFETTFLGYKQLFDSNFVEWFRNPGQALINNLTAMGDTLDYAANLIKAPLLAAVKGENVGTRLLDAYGLGDNGRVTQNMSELREVIGAAPSGIIGGTAAGAVIGLQAGGPWGAAIGAGIGLTAGTITGIAGEYNQIWANTINDIALEYLVDPANIMSAFKSAKTATKVSKHLAKTPDDIIKNSQELYSTANTLSKFGSRLKTTAQQAMEDFITGKRANISAEEITQSIKDSLASELLDRNEIINRLKFFEEHYNDAKATLEELKNSVDLNFEAIKNESLRLRASTAFYNKSLEQYKSLRGVHKDWKKELELINSAAGQRKALKQYNHRLKKVLTSLYDDDFKTFKNAMADTGIYRQYAGISEGQMELLYTQLKLHYNFGMANKFINYFVKFDNALSKKVFESMPFVAAFTITSKAIRKGIKLFRNINDPFMKAKYKLWEEPIPKEAPASQSGGAPYRPTLIGMGDANKEADTFSSYMPVPVSEVRDHYADLKVNLNHDKTFKWLKTKLTDTKAKASKDYTVDVSDEGIDEMISYINNKEWSKSIQAYKDNLKKMKSVKLTRGMSVYTMESKINFILRHMRDALKDGKGTIEDAANAIAKNKDVINAFDSVMGFITDLDEFGYYILLSYLSNSPINDELFHLLTKDAKMELLSQVDSGTNAVFFSAAAAVLIKKYIEESAEHKYVQMLHKVADGVKADIKSINTTVDNINDLKYNAEIALKEKYDKPNGKYRKKYFKLVTDIENGNIDDLTKDNYGILIKGVVEDLVDEYRIYAQKRASYDRNLVYFANIIFNEKLPSVASIKEGPMADYVRGAMHKIKQAIMTNADDGNEGIVRIETDMIHLIEQVLDALKEKGVDFNTFNQIADAFWFGSNPYLAKAYKIMATAINELANMPKYIEDFIASYETQLYFQKKYGPNNKSIIAVLEKYVELGKAIDAKLQKDATAKKSMRLIANELFMHLINGTPLSEGTKALLPHDIVEQFQTLIINDMRQVIADLSSLIPISIRSNGVAAIFTDVLEKYELAMNKWPVHFASVTHSYKKAYTNNAKIEINNLAVKYNIPKKFNMDAIADVYNTYHELCTEILEAYKAMKATGHKEMNLDIVNFILNRFKKQINIINEECVLYTDYMYLRECVTGDLLMRDNKQSYAPLLEAFRTLERLRVTKPELRPAIKVVVAKVLQKVLDKIDYLYNRLYAFVDNEPHSLRLIGNIRAQDEFINDNITIFKYLDIISQELGVTKIIKKSVEYKDAVVNLLKEIITSENPSINAIKASNDVVIKSLENLKDIIAQTIAEYIQPVAKVSATKGYEIKQSDKLKPIGLDSEISGMSSNEFYTEKVAITGDGLSALQIKNSAFSVVSLDADNETIKAKLSEKMRDIQISDAYVSDLETTLDDAQSVIQVAIRNDKANYSLLLYSPEYSTEGYDGMLSPDYVNGNLAETFNEADYIAFKNNKTNQVSWVSETGVTHTLFRNITDYVKAIEKAYEPYTINIDGKRYWFIIGQNSANFDAPKLYKLVNQYSENKLAGIINIDTLPLLRAYKAAGVVNKYFETYSKKPSIKGVEITELDIADEINSLYNERKELISSQQKMLGKARLDDKVQALDKIVRDIQLVLVRPNFNQKTKATYKLKYQQAYTQYIDALKAAKQEIENSYEYRKIEEAISEVDFYIEQRTSVNPTELVGINNYSIRINPVLNIAKDLPDLRLETVYTAFVNAGLIKSESNVEFHNAADDIKATQKIARLLLGGFDASIGEAMEYVDWIITKYNEYWIEAINPHIRKLNALLKLVTGASYTDLQIRKIGLQELIENDNQLANRIADLSDAIEDIDSLIQRAQNKLDNRELISEAAHSAEEVNFNYVAISECILDINNLITEYIDLKHELFKQTYGDAMVYPQRNHFFNTAYIMDQYIQNVRNSEMFLSLKAIYEGKKIISNNPFIRMVANYVRNFKHSHDFKFHHTLMSKYFDYVTRVDAHYLFLSKLYTQAHKALSNATPEEALKIKQAFSVLQSLLWGYGKKEYESLDRLIIKTINRFSSMDNIDAIKTELSEIILVKLDMIQPKIMEQLKILGDEEYLYKEILKYISDCIDNIDKYHLHLADANEYSILSPVLGKTQRQMFREIYNSIIGLVTELRGYHKRKDGSEFELYITDEEINAAISELDDMLMYMTEPLSKIRRDNIEFKAQGAIPAAFIQTQTNMSLWEHNNSGNTISYVRTPASQEATALKAIEDLFLEKIGHKNDGMSHVIEYQPALSKGKLAWKSILEFTGITQNEFRNILYMNSITEKSKFNLQRKAEIFDMLVKTDLKVYEIVLEQIETIHSYYRGWLEESKRLDEVFMQDVMCYLKAVVITAIMSSSRDINTASEMVNNIKKQAKQYALMNRMYPILKDDAFKNFSEVDLGDSRFLGIFNEYYKEYDEYYDNINVRHEATIDATKDAQNTVRMTPDAVNHRNFKSEEQFRGLGHINYDLYLKRYREVYYYTFKTQTAIQDAVNAARELAFYEVYMSGGSIPIDSEVSRLLYKWRFNSKLPYKWEREIFEREFDDAYNKYKEHFSKKAEATKDNQNRRAAYMGRQMGEAHAKADVYGYNRNSSNYRPYGPEAQKHYEDAYKKSYDESKARFENDYNQRAKDNYEYHRKKHQEYQERKAREDIEKLLSNTKLDTINGALKTAREFKLQLIALFTDYTGKTNWRALYDYLQTNSHLKVVAIYKSGDFRNRYTHKINAEVHEINIDSIDKFIEYMKHHDNMVEFAILDKPTILDLRKTLGHTGNNRVYKSHMLNNLVSIRRAISTYIMSPLKNLSLLSIGFTITNFVEGAVKTLIAAEGNRLTIFRNYYNAIKMHKRYTELSRLIVNAAENSPFYRMKDGLKILDYEMEVGKFLFENWEELINNPAAKPIINQLFDTHKSKLPDYVLGNILKGIQRGHLDFDEYAKRFRRIANVYFNELPKYDLNEYRLINNFINSSASASEFQNIMMADDLEKVGNRETKTFSGKIDNIYKKYLFSNNFFLGKYTPLKYITPYANLARNSSIELINRLALYLDYGEKGFIKSEALSKVLATHFNYGNKSQAEMAAELLVPFISYPLRNYTYWMNALMEHPSLLKSFVDTALTNWGDEKDNQYNQTKITKGGIRLWGNVSIESGLSAFDAMAFGGNALNVLTQRKLNPLVSVAIEGAKQLAVGQSNLDYRLQRLPIMTHIKTGNELVGSLQKGKVNLYDIAPSLFNEVYKNNRYYYNNQGRYAYKSAYSRLYTSTGFNRHNGSNKLTAIRYKVIK